MKRSLVWARFGVFCQAICFFGLLVFAVDLLRTRCESFGCIGLGIAWFLWSGFFAASVLLGCLSFFMVPKNDARVLYYAKLFLFLDALLLLVLLIIWALKTWLSQSSSLLLTP